MSSDERNAGAKSASLTGKSASQIARGLKARGSGSMGKGVTKTQQKGYWQGRADAERLKEKK